MSFGNSHVVVIKLGSYNTVVDIIPYNIYLLGNGSTSSNSSLSIDNYYTNENNHYFASSIYGSETDGENFSLEQEGIFTKKVEDFITKDKIVNWKHFGHFLDLVFKKIREKMSEETSTLNLSVFVVSSLNISCLNRTFSLLMEQPEISQVRFIPIYLSLLYNYPMGNYLQHQQNTGFAIGVGNEPSLEETYEVSGGLGKLYQDFILSSDLSASTSTLPGQHVNMNVTTNPILLQNISYLSNFQTSTGFQGNSLIVDVGYKETKVYFIEHFKNLRDFETTFKFGCSNIVEDIKQTTSEVNSDDISCLLESGWIDFQPSDFFTSGINNAFNLQANGEEDEEEELDVAKILASGEIDQSNKTNTENEDSLIAGKNIKYRIGENDTIAVLARSLGRIASMKTGQKFPDTLSFSKMLENVIISGSLGRSKSFRDSFVQLLKYQLLPKSSSEDFPNTNPFCFSVKYVHPASYFPNWKDDNSQPLPVSRNRHNKNTFDSEIKGALIVSRHGFEQLLSYPKSAYTNSYGYSIFDGIVSFARPAS